MARSDFKTGADSWQVGFADFAVYQDTTADFFYEQKVLPAPLDTTKKSLRVSGYNRSDDLFMYVKKRITGLRPDTDYELQFNVEFASNASNASFGVGGSPGASVYLKVGASAVEPAKILVGDHFRMNIDKGNQATDGKDMVVIGNVGADTEEGRYELVQRTNATKSFSAKTSATGELWLIVGTDSGFEAKTDLYYNKIEVISR